MFALGLPVPPYVGYPLDPPLRSRFQSRDFKSPELKSQVNQVLSLIKIKHISRDLIKRLVSFSMVLDVQNEKNSNCQIEVPEFHMMIKSLASPLSLVPNIHPRFLVDIFYPFALLLTCDLEQLSVMQQFRCGWYLDLLPTRPTHYCRA